LIEQKMKEFEEKFTQEGPLKTYREMRHEYYLNCTDIEAFIRRAMEEAVAAEREQNKPIIERIKLRLAHLERLITNSQPTK
ncbi:MAG: hypothetical protein ACH349_07615, partial [Candidatus Rhabdochlamydia sp.]